MISGKGVEIQEPLTIRANWGYWWWV
jgi:hypothetical protein